MQKAVALVTLADQDWKTQLAHKYSNIPANAVVNVVEDNVNNLYGSWCRVEWNNNMYYVSKKDLSFNQEDIEYAERTKGEIEQYKDKFR